MTTHFADKFFANAQKLPMHRHQAANVTLVLSGTYEEKSVDGRFLLPTGTLIYHPGFHAHANHFQTGNAQVLNMELKHEASWFPHYRAVSLSQGEVHHLAPLMRGDEEAASDMIHHLIERRGYRPAPPPAWMAFVARALALCREPIAIKDIAARLGISPEHLTRAFQAEFGISPSNFRKEHRMRRALSSLRLGKPLAEAACTAGFADQSHMGRALKAMLGLTPAAVRDMTAS